MAVGGGGGGNSLGGGGGADGCGVGGDLSYPLAFVCEAAAAAASQKPKVIRRNTNATLIVSS